MRSIVVISSLVLASLTVFAQEPLGDIKLVSEIGTCLRLDNTPSIDDFENDHITSLENNCKTTAEKIGLDFESIGLAISKSCSPMTYIAVCRFKSE